MPNTSTTTQTSARFPDLKPFYKLWIVGDSTPSGILSMLYRLAGYDVADGRDARSFSQITNIVNPLLPDESSDRLNRATEAAHMYYLWAFTARSGDALARTTQSSDDALTRHRQEHAPCTASPAATPSAKVSTDDIIASIRKRIVAFVNDAVVEWERANSIASRAEYRVDLKTAAHTLAREIATSDVSELTSAAPENTSRVGFEDASW